MDKKTPEPLIPAATNLPEFSFRAVILAIVLAALLAAADAYLALRIATTIAASIPAAVVAMGVLRLFKQSNVLEINLVQTAASAGEGVAAAMAFVLPAMIITHAWTRFPYWETMLITLLGGFLGVLFSIPLRRILLSLPLLSFPEGTAIGNVMRASTAGGRQLHLLIQGLCAGGILSFIQNGSKIIADNIQLWASAGRALFGTAISFEPALLAAGYIVGIRVGISLLVGVILGWSVILPYLALHYGVTALALTASNTDKVMQLWHDHLRFVGIGVLLIGGIWTLVQLAKPVLTGLKIAAKASSKNQAGSGEYLIRTERDIPFSWMILGTLLVTIIMAIMVYVTFLNADLPSNITHPLFLIVNTLFAVVFILVIGFILATICGYMAGLIGTTNSPMSGLLIIALLLLGLLFLFLFQIHSRMEAAKLTNIMILLTAIIGGICTVSIENIQDLKAGQLVGATPWKQQAILLIGVVVSSLVIAPVLQLLFNAYGIGGVFPHSGMDPHQMLAAPQAGMIATIAQGVLLHHLNWDMLILGGVVAVLCIIVDEYLKTKHARLLVLAVGLGIYLPAEIDLTIFLGSFVHFLAQLKQRRQHPINSETDHQGGTLLACGLVAGSALMGVILAIPFVLLGSGDALALVGPQFAPIATVLGVLATLGLALWLYFSSTSKTIKK